jgi:curved DNA-binding protein CbpA
MSKAIESPLIRSFRELLGVEVRASLVDIKKAYRNLAVLYHPDRNPDPEAQKQFIKITEAYEALSDPETFKTLNRKYLREELLDKKIEGINVRFGSFFGYRVFTAGQRVKRAQRIGTEKSGESDQDLAFFKFNVREESHSIMDSSAYDSLELVYGGKFSLNDEQRVQKGFKSTDLGQLPWILLNNKGILLFLEGRFEECLKCYQELNERIPGNVIFLYRLGLCESILAFKKKRKKLLGSEVPDSKHLKNAFECFRKAIVIGENRSVGKQRCLTIRKTLAEILEKSGNLSASRKVWRDVYDIDPRSKEALYKLQSSTLLLRRRD